MTQEEKRKKELEYKRRYNAEHKKEKAEYMKVWAEKNKKHLKEYKKEYCSGEDYKKYRKAYYEEHKEEIYKSQTEYRHRNAKKVSQMVYQCRLRKYEKLKSEGVCNAWAVINYGETPRYEYLRKGRKKKNA